MTPSSSSEILDHIVVVPLDRHDILTTTYSVRAALNGFSAEDYLRDITLCREISKWALDNDITIRLMHPRHEPMTSKMTKEGILAFDDPKHAILFKLSFL